MKKSVLFIIFLLCISVVIAQDENVTIDASQQKVDKAYECLRNKVEGKCGSLSIEEKIFSALAVGECSNELVVDSLSNECWPSSGCKLKTTAQAILALDKTGKNTKTAEDWLLSQTTSPEDVVWYLQIDSREETSCDIIYDGSTYNVILEEDKTLKRTSTGLGQCLALSNEDYWLKIFPGCYDKEFEISCDKDFQTSLIFKQTDSSIIHVSEELTSAAAHGKTKEKIESKCFMENGRCNYEGSLWAAVVLKYLGYNEEVEAFIPYLTTTAEGNSRYLPSSFLYSLTGNENYRNELLLEQKSNKFWDETGDKFYDTAVALQAISDEPLEKTNTKNWLLEIQDAQGCWQGNIRNTAFLLAAIWPTYVEPTQSECERSGYYCGTEAACEGNILSDYVCPGIAKCCDSLPVIKSCSEQGGTICPSGETCAGGTTPGASDTSAGEVCCVQGTCQVPTSYNECELFGGTCRTSCSSGETQETYECDFVGDVCCIEETQDGKASYWWIWLLSILIILTALGIIFRNKLRPYWYKLTSRFKKFGGRGGPSLPRGPPGPGTQPPGTPGGINPLMPRQIPRQFPQARPRPAIRPKPQTPASDLDKVLGKLKSMGKK